MNRSVWQGETERNPEPAIPPPPPDIDQRPLPIKTLQAHEINLFRGHGISKRYSPVDYNFNSDADTRFGAFIESLGHNFTLGEHRILTLTYLKHRCLCQLSLDAEASTLKLVNLTDGSKDGYAALNLDNQITTEKTRWVTREWALAFFQHPDQPDGILYRACNDVSRESIALFHRAGDIVTPGCENFNYLADDESLGELLDHYGVGLVE